MAQSNYKTLGLGIALGLGLSMTQAYADHNLTKLIKTYDKKECSRITNAYTILERDSGYRARRKLAGLENRLSEQHELLRKSIKRLMEKKKLDSKEESALYLDLLLDKDYHTILDSESQR